MNQLSKIWILKGYNIFFTGVSLILVFITNSCGVYSFSGVNIPPDIKTISIQNIYNNSGNGPANMGQKFTDDFRNYIQRNTNLNILNSEGDLRFDGSITGYATTPVSPTASSAGNPYPTTSQTRLTITIKINYVNSKDEKANYEQTFSQYEDFPEGQSLTTVESELIAKINQKLIFDIFNKSFSNW